MRPLQRRYRHSISARTAAIILGDAVSAALALIIALALRTDGGRAGIYLQAFPAALPLFVIVSVGAFAIFRLHRRLWRFSSVTDLVAIGAAATLAVSGFVLLLATIGKLGWMPRSIPVLLWLMLITLMGGVRIARRALADYLGGIVRPPRPLGEVAGNCRRVLVVGASDQVERVLRYIERERGTLLDPVGILDHVEARASLCVRGVPILGAVSELARVVQALEATARRPECLLFAGDPGQLNNGPMVSMVAAAHTLGLEIAYLPGLTEYDPARGRKIDLRFVDAADLLGRPQVQLDARLVGEALRGRSVLVTGAGGTIGRELMRQIAAFGPRKLILLDASEINLYEADLEMRENHAGVPRAAVLCSIRQRAQLMQVFAEHRPDLVFHAAALKHVPIVEEHPAAAVQTNVLGTRNVADAALRYGAIAMVQVSTDKAVNPVGFMGVTKRLGELYCQALDLEGCGRPRAPRFMTVRFGNVLGSSGSLIPLFQRQLKKGGPLTVTHPEITRFFMTVHEAVQLVLHSAARGMTDQETRGRIFVLDMGEPVRVMDIARRMIRLSGLRPGVDVDIEIVGLRPGEKLYEELFDTREKRSPSPLEGVFEAASHIMPKPMLQRVFRQLAEAAEQGDDAACRAIAVALLAEETEPRPLAPVPQMARRELLAHSF
jgi:O-antigen biosynthesis protein WbqV